ncbi:MAG: hypothetical protein K2X27_06030 [Candidatus Obscuribacterales bacterium]|nr:hypothetical protein [Candidatus Obscuribacterales bacterium]
MNSLQMIEEEVKSEKVQRSQTFARRASGSSVIHALPQPGGADILRAKKQLMQSQN